MLERHVEGMRSGKARITTSMSSIRSGLANFQPLVSLKSRTLNHDALCRDLCMRRFALGALAQVQQYTQTGHEKSCISVNQLYDNTSLPQP